MSALMPAILCLPDLPFIAMSCLLIFGHDFFDKLVRNHDRR